MNVELVPIAMFIAIAVILSFFIFYRYQIRKEVQVTVRSAIDRGQDLSPELLERLSESLRPRNIDLRRGIISVALAFSFAGFALILGEEDAVRPFLAFAVFPFLVGIAYLGLWKFSGK